MRSAAAIFTGLALLGAAPAWAARPPVVVELFTAQGCSSCAPATEAVAALAEREDVLSLTFSVDYWDYLGWKDTFADGAFSDRQRAYAKHFGIRDVYTPQVVIDGKVQASGAKPAAGGAEVWLVRYDERAQQVNVRRGDNRGQTLDYRNVVRQLVRLGPWAGRPRAYRLPPAAEEGLSTAILVQGARGGAMIGVMTIPAEKVEEASAR